MFRRLLKNQCGLLQSQSNRWEEIARFASLRASLNKESTQAFAELAKQNNVSTQELQDINQVVSINLETLEQNLQTQAFATEKEAAFARFRQTSLATNGKLQKVQAQLAAKNANFGSQIAGVAGYKEAYGDLKTLFLGETAVQNQVAQYLANLREQNKNDSQTVDAIQRTLSKIIENLSLDRAVTQARLASVLQSHGVVAPVQTVIVTRERPADNLDLDAVFVAQENKEILNRLGQGSWENDRKIIFQAIANTKSEFPFLLVAILCGASFAYFLYSGDAKYKTLLLTPVVGIAALLLLQKNQVSNRTRVLTKLLLHKDGKHVDAVVSRGGCNSTLSGLPISSLKLTRGDPRITLNLSADSSVAHIFANDLKQENNGGDYSINFSKIRSLAASQGQLITLGDQQVVVPFIHSGNGLLLKSIFQGVNVPASA